jgi:hypothetical protein
MNIHYDADQCHIGPLSRARAGSGTRFEMKVSHEATSVAPFSEDHLF